ncbi:YybH family protein [Spirosoma arcticum]
MENPVSHESAFSPDDLPKFFVQRANEGNIDGLADLYESNAVLACGDGKVIIGTEAIRRFYAELLTTRPQFTRGIQAPTLQNGELALTSSRLKNGNVTAEVARRQSDVTWLWALDQPVINAKP